MAQTITPTKTEPVFFSKVNNLVKVRDPGYTEVLSSGQPRTITPGLRYEFQNGYLVVDDELRERDADYFAKYAEVLGPKVDTRPAEEWLRDQIAGEFGPDGRALVDRLVEGTFTHAVRREHEMRDALAVIEASGEPADMTRATLAWLERIAAQLD